MRYPGVVFVDAARPLPFADNAVWRINGEHLVEHLPYPVAQAFFAECYRVLQPDGVLRISTPDLHKLMIIDAGDFGVAAAEELTYHQQYHNPAADTLCAWFNDHMRLWGHTFLFDESTLFHAVRRAGFSQPEWCAYGQRRHPELQGIERHDEGVAWTHQYVMILEVTKVAAA